MVESAPHIEEGLNIGSAVEIESTDTGRIEKELSDQLVELNNRHLRLQAEFENFRKRKAKEADDIRQYAAVPYVERMLTVLDHFYLALDPSHDRTDPKWGEGIDIIARELLEAMKGFGLEEIPVRRGDKFEPDLHDAVAHGSDPDIGPSCVLQVVRKGYRLKDRVIRHAHVIVTGE